MRALRPLLIAGLLLAPFAMTGCGHSLGRQVASTHTKHNLVIQNAGLKEIEVYAVRGKDTPEELGSCLGKVRPNTIGHFYMDRHKTITFFFDRTSRSTRQETISFSSGVRYYLNEQAELIQTEPVP